MALDDRGTGSPRLQDQPRHAVPMLHALERKGNLTSRIERAGRSQRRIYRATPYGIEASRIARGKVRELVRKVTPESDIRRAHPKPTMPREPDDDAPG